MFIQYESAGTTAKRSRRVSTALRLGPHRDRRPVPDAPPVENRRIALLQLLGADRAQWPNLYEPRLIALGAKEIKFLGFERHEGRAWVLQQWDCELL
jgi:hypothetical protein